MSRPLLLLSIGLSLAGCRAATPTAKKAEQDRRSTPAPPPPTIPASQPASLATTLPPASQPRKEIPRLFGALFEERRTWTYAFTRVITTEDFDPDANENKASKEKTARRARCVVERIEQADFGWISRIRCVLTQRMKNLEGAQDLDGNDLPRHTTDPGALGAAAYVANARGLWRGHRASTAARLKELLSDPPLLPAAPRPTKKGGIAKRMVKVGGAKVSAWCRENSGRVNVDGGSWDASCYAEGYGLVFERDDLQSGSKTMDGVAGVEDTLTLIDTKRPPE